MNKQLLKAGHKTYFKLSRKKYKITGRVSQNTADLTAPAGARRLWINDQEVLPETAFALRPFYECDLGWGRNGGLAAYTSALAVCLHIFGEERIAENLFERFKEEFVVFFPEDDFEIDIDLSGFLKKHKMRLQSNLYSRFCYTALFDSREILMFKDPESGLITVNIAENYVAYPHMLP